MSYICFEIANFTVKHIVLTIVELAERLSNRKGKQVAF